MDHWTLCSLTYNLNSSLNGILLAFYIGNLYFLWSHLMSVTWPPVYSSLYLLYQSWALIRQWIRFCLVTYFATKTSSTLVWPLRQAMSLENSVEAKKIQVRIILLIKWTSKTLKILLNFWNIIGYPSKVVFLPIQCASPDLWK